jgi:hypothetical protein
VAVVLITATIYVWATVSAKLERAGLSAPIGRRGRTWTGLRLGRETRPQSEVIIVAMVRRACRGSRTAAERVRRKFLRS